jgi:ssDNA-binding Zn-finger/Zn-ribbon topoisomerase 1
MKCLHGEPASTSTTKNGSFWFCDQNPSCNFFCSEHEGYQFEKAIAVEQPQPQCHGHHKPARMRIVKDLMKGSYGRPFVCSDKKSPCSS